MYFERNAQEEVKKFVPEQNDLVKVGSTFVHVLNLHDNCIWG